MIVGVPKERKIQEYRVALTDGLPSAARMTRGLKVREILRESIDDDDSFPVLKPSKEWEGLNLPMACKAWLQRHL